MWFNYNKMDYLGLDIGHHSIKAAWIKKKGKKEFLLALGEAVNPTNGDFWHSDKQREAIAGTIRKLVGDLQIKPKLVVAGLSESRVVSRMISMPPMKESEIARALRYEAETFIPYPLKDVQIDYRVINKNSDGRQDVFVVAAKTEAVRSIEAVLDKAGLVPVALENTAIALARSLVPLRETPTLILEMGSSNTIAAIAKQGSVYMTRILPLGGEAFTRSVRLSLGMDVFKAEEYKKAYGLKKGEWKDKIRSALLEVLNNLISETRKTIIAFKEEWKEGVDLIILSGGGAMMPGLSEEILAVMGVEVQWADSLANLDITKIKTTIDLKKEKLRYSTVIGLAQRNL